MEDSISPSSAGTLDAVRRIADVLMPPLAWAGPWVAFVAVAKGHQTHLTRYRIAATALVVSNLIVLFGVLLRRRTRDLRRAYLFAGFLFTLAALVGTYACIDIATSRVHPDCYANAAGVGVGLGKTDAVYYALSTLTTAGYGDITAHSVTCRSLTITELAIGFPVLGLSIAAVAARLFQNDEV